MAAIQNVRIHHEMILTWLILNPEKTQGQCALEFGVTEAWLSTIINSDCFQARWAERRASMQAGADGVVMGSMREVALKGLKRLSDRVEVECDTEILLNTTDKLLGRLGYGPKMPGAGSVTQNNVFLVDQELLAQARARIAAQGQQYIPTPTVELLDAEERNDAE